MKPRPSKSRHPKRQQYAILSTQQVKHIKGGADAPPDIITEDVIDV
ncbi:MAG: hypothetical protein AAFV95_23685 [Bacteroidota bacterium]